MASISILIDDDLNEQAGRVFDAIGLDMTTAVTAFLKQAVLCGGMPFPMCSDTTELRLDEADAEALRPASRLTHEEFFRQARARIGDA